MKKLLISIILVGVVGVAGWRYLQSHDFVLWSMSMDSATIQKQNNDTSGKEVPLQQPTPNAQGLSTYTDAQYNFSLSYPVGYRIGKFGEGAGNTFIIQDDKGVGMQLLVTPFDENITLTPERIKKDLPTLPMTDVRQVTLPAGGVSAVVFKSSGGGFGDSIELWFVYKGNLYQASSYLLQLTFLEGVMGTFHF